MKSKHYVGETFSWLRQSSEADVLTSFVSITSGTSPTFIELARMIRTYALEFWRLKSIPL